MRRIIFLSFLIYLAGLPLTFGQDWKQFISREDMFVANFPGDPVVTEIRWISEHGADVPAHTYTVKKGPSTYSLTVVDYNLVKKTDIENAKKCPPENLERCPGINSYAGEGYWKDDIRGAMVYAESKILQRDVKLTHFMWNYLGQGIESNEMQLINNEDRSRTFANIYMHLNQLYVVEATSPANYPPPNIFTESVGLLDEDGNSGSHEGVYFNGARVDPSEKIARVSSIRRGDTSGQSREGEEWKEYTSKVDLFTVNFPGQPVVTDMPWKSEYGSYLPAYVYTVKKGPSTYSVTVVNYNLAKILDIEKARTRCPKNNLERCTGDTSYSGDGYWKNDIRGAMINAEFRILQRDAKLAHFKWNRLAQGIESNEVQLINNVDKSRTFAVIAMHLNRLYIVEATSPTDYPPPSLITDSVTLLTEDGFRATHEGVYFNGSRVEPFEVNTRLTGILSGQVDGQPQATPSQSSRESGR